MWKVFPKEEPFFKMLLEAAENGLHASERLVQMMSCYQAPADDATAIKEAEHRGDELTHEIIRRLDRTFLTPIDREDIHALASIIDDVLDLVDAVADRMVLFKIPTPTEEARQLAELIQRSLQEVCRGIALLGKRDHSVIYQRCVEINRLENEADHVNRLAMAKLFESGDGPVEIIKWKEIYEYLEQATDRTEDVANILESIVLKNT
jgi:predicted phosphate transport protein (TIGR00153 family)